MSFNKLELEMNGSLSFQHVKLIGFFLYVWNISKYVMIMRV